MTAIEIYKKAIDNYDGSLSNLFTRKELEAELKELLANYEDDEAVLMRNLLEDQEDDESELVDSSEEPTT